MKWMSVRKEDAEDQDGWMNIQILWLLPWFEEHLSPCSEIVTAHY